MDVRSLRRPFKVPVMSSFRCTGKSKLLCACQSEACQSEAEGKGVRQKTDK